MLFFLTAYACTCTTPGVSCTTDCSPTFCLCDESYKGTLMSTSAGTRCLNGNLVYESQCLSPTYACAADGFYCSSPCSVTYSYCVNGIRTPEQFVPIGTVCDTNETDGFGSLVYPDACASLNTTIVARCPTDVASIQCLAPCSPTFYYCVHYNAYVVQMAPTGLMCYENDFVLASDPICTGLAAGQAFPVVIASQDWSVLRQYSMAKALAAALRTSGVAVEATDIYFAQMGRRLSDSEQMMYIRSSATYLSNALSDAMDRLPAMLGTNVPVTMWLPSPVATATAAATAAANATAVFHQMLSGAATYVLTFATCGLFLLAILLT